MSYCIYRLLTGNKLSGTLPDELGNLSYLDRLQVDENQLSGPILQSFAHLIRVKHQPVDLQTICIINVAWNWISCESNLLNLFLCSHLNNNSFNGQPPHELSKLTSLLHLWALRHFFIFLVISDFIASFVFPPFFLVLEEEEEEKNTKLKLFCQFLTL